IGWFVVVTVRTDEAHPVRHLQVLAGIPLVAGTAVDERPVSAAPHPATPHLGDEHQQDERGDDQRSDDHRVGVLPAVLPEPTDGTTCRREVTQSWWPRSWCLSLPPSPPAPSAAR